MKSTFDPKAKTNVGGAKTPAPSTTIGAIKPRRAIKYLDPEKFCAVRPFSILIVGEPCTSKTHMACTFPKWAMADTENKSWNVVRKFPSPKWFLPQNFDDVRQWVYQSVEDSGIETLIIDTASAMQDWAMNEYLDEHPQAKGDTKYQAVYSGGGQKEWSKVYEKMDELIRMCAVNSKKLIFTARLKDEYIGEHRTGGRIPQIYKNVLSEVHIAVRLATGIPSFDNKTKYQKYRIFGKVLKNSFVDIGTSKPYLFECSWKGILAELMDPFFPKGANEEKRAALWGKMCEEAESL